MRGTLRWARADLRARRGQALLTVGVVGGVVAALFFAVVLLQGAVNPWQQLFDRTRGADVLIYFANGTNTGDLYLMSGVQAVARPYQAASATLEQGPARSPVELRAMTPALPAISAPLVVAGTWLRPSAPDGAVLEASFAAAVHVGVGSTITVDGIDGTEAQIRVIGIADTADQGFYPQWTPGLIWVQQPLLDKVEPNPSEREDVVGLRLQDDSAVATGQVVQAIWNFYNGPDQNSASAVERYSTWQQVKQSMASDDRLLGLLLALFGIIALVAAPCAIANVTAARVLLQRQDIAMLKALGFTPGQVVRMLLAEQTLLGAAGAGLGLVVARVATLPEFVRQPDGTPVSLGPLSGSWMVLIAVGTVLTVAVATVIPAWRAGQVSPLAALQPSPPRGHLSLLARLGLLVHLPVALVLGARDSLTRRLPAAATVFGLAIPMAMITIALTCWSTVDGFSDDAGEDRPRRRGQGQPGRPDRQADGHPHLPRRPGAGVVSGSRVRHPAARRQRHLHRAGHGHLGPALPLPARGGPAVPRGQRGRGRPGLPRPDAHPGRGVDLAHDRRRAGDLPHRRPDHRAG